MRLPITWSDGACLSEVAEGLGVVLCHDGIGLLRDEHEVQWIAYLRGDVERLLGGWVLVWRRRDHGRRTGGTTGRLRGRMISGRVEGCLGMEVGLAVDIECGVA